MQKHQQIYYADEFIPGFEPNVSLAAHRCTHRTIAGFKESFPEVKEFWMEQVHPTVTPLPGGGMHVLVTVIFVWHARTPPAEE